jgi:hypothetical protein
VAPEAPVAEGLAVPAAVAAPVAGLEPEAFAVVLPPSVKPVAVAEADPLPVPVNEVVRVQEHDVLKYAEETMAGLAESTLETDAPMVVGGVIVPEAEAEAEVEDGAAIDAIRKKSISSCNIGPGLK